MSFVGRLRHRVRIEEFAPLPDSNGDDLQNDQTGEVVREWSTVFECWAGIEPMSVREFISAQSFQSEVTTRIVMWTPSRIDAAMRIVHLVNGAPGTIYNIHGILPDKDSGREYVTIPASAGANNG